MKILLTGSSSGIGRHLAAHLCSHGHEVWGGARSSQADFQRECQAHRQVFHAVGCDVSNWAAVATARQQVGLQCAHLDALICAAGAQPPIGPAMTLDPNAWMANVELNLGGTFFVIRAFHDLLRKGERRAKIVCFSGGGATGPRPNFTAYGVSKAAIVRLCETLAQEWAGQPIDINAIAPGAINTKMTEELLSLGAAVVGEKEYGQAQKQKQAGGHSLEKVAGLVEFLLSPQSDGVTGRLLSAQWDGWSGLPAHREELARSDIYTLRRIIPEDRGQKWE